MLRVSHINYIFSGLKQVFSVCAVDIGIATRQSLAQKKKGGKMGFQQIQMQLKKEYKTKNQKAVKNVWDAKIECPVFN